MVVKPQITANPVNRTVGKFSYGAGGQIKTVKGKNIVETDWQGQNPNTLGRRTQKIYADIQGRTYKTQVMNWDGVTPYTTTLFQFNGRDQATSVKRYEGVETSQIFQETTQTYDGHGRLKTQHRPEQNTGAVATYNYNADDGISSMMDARGASTNYSYNTRGLVEQISYGVPSGSQIQVTPTATFSYDAIGNRTSMQDGLGTVSYEYNQLSQMTAETRSFTDTLANAPLPNNSFKLEYDYTLSGQLKSLKDPYGQQFNYAFDKVGRLNSVTGTTAFGGTTNYASNPQYRAWGGLKGLTYGNGLQMAQTFDNRLQTASYSLTGATNPTMQKNYQYYADGQLKYVGDVLNPVFDRLNKYDHLGRIKEAKSGAEARNQSAASPWRRTLPYRQSYQYDAFDNLTQRNNLNWGYSQVQGLRHFNLDYSYNYQNNRVVGIFNWTYDADGRNTYSSSPDENVYSTYDAAGQLVKTNQGASVETVRVFDGLGEAVKSTARDIGNGEIRTKYYLRSSVVGEIISEANTTGKKLKTSIYAAGATLARQIVGYDAASGNPTLQDIEFEQWDASGMSYRRTFGNVIGSFDGVSEAGETDPLGGGVGLDGLAYFEANLPPERDYLLRQPSGFEDVAVYQNGAEIACYEDGVLTSCGRAYRNLENGSAIPKVHLRQERDPRRKTKSPAPVIFETHGFGRISILSRGTTEAPPPPGQPNNPDTSYGTIDRWITYFFPISSSSQPQTRQQLPKCIRDFLRQYFPSVKVGNTTYSPVDDARFISGIPWYAAGVEGAITLGLFDIHYNPANGKTGVDLTGGQDKSSIGVIAEEIAHAYQFLNIWSSLEFNQGTKKRQATYSEAQTEWAARYLLESGLIEAKNLALIFSGDTSGRYLQDSYKDNKYEVDAKKNYRARAENDATLLQKSPCP